MPGNIDLGNNDAVIADISGLRPIWAYRITFMKVAAVSASFTSDMKNVTRFLWCYICASRDGNEHVCLKVAKMRTSIIKAMLVCRLSGGKTVLHKVFRDQRQSTKHKLLFFVFINYV